MKGLFRCAQVPAGVWQAPWLVGPHVGNLKLKVSVPAPIPVPVVQPCSSRLQPEHRSATDTQLRRQAASCLGCSAKFSVVVALIPAQLCNPSADKSPEHPDKLFEDVWGDFLKELDLLGRFVEFLLLEQAGNNGRVS